MRILVASDQWFPDRMGGVARVASDTARGWAEHGHEVVAIVPESPSAPERASEQRVSVCRVLPRGRLPQTLTDPAATRRAAERMASRDFDVLVAHSPTSAAGLLAAGLDAPLVYVFHADAAKEARYLRGRISPGREWVAAFAFERRLRSMTRRALEAASAVIVLSEFSRGLVAELAPGVASAATVVSGAVDTDRFTPHGRESARAALAIEERTRLVFTARRLEPRMGLENLLEATALLDDVPDLRVVVAGSGSRFELENVRDRLGLAGRVDLVGRIPDEELARWYRAADLFVLPTIAYEGFGLATAEALASGTPVVGTPVGATPELLEPLDPELIARGVEPPDLAEAIRAGLVRATPALRARCREHALARLSWIAVLPLWERVLEDAASARTEDASPQEAAALPEVEGQ